MIGSRWSDHRSFLAFFFGNGTTINVVSNGILALGDRLSSLLDFMGMLGILRVELVEDPFLFRGILARF